MCKVTMVISTLTSGGAERVLSNMANYWSSKGWEITFITFSSVDDFYKLDESISRISLDSMNDNANLKSRVLGGIKRFFLLRNAIKNSESDAVISFLTSPNILTILATRFLNVRVVISERSVPFKSKLGRIKNITRRILYPMADRVVVQSSSVKEWAETFIPPKKVFIIPNSVGKIKSNNFIDKGMLDLLGGKNVIAVGRLEKVKGFDILIKAFYLYAQKNLDSNLIILGEGSERESLEKLIVKYNLSSRVFLPGRVTNPHDFMKKCDLYVLSSLYEGFPNGLIEAMSLGMPVIVSDCPGGAEEIIVHNENGLISKVGDFEDLSGKIDLLLSNPHLATKLSKNAVKINEELHPTKVMNKWEETLFSNKRSI